MINIGYNDIERDTKRVEQNLQNIPQDNEHNLHELLTVALANDKVEVAEIRGNMTKYANNVATTWFSKAPQWEVVALFYTENRKDLDKLKGIIGDIEDHSFFRYKSKYPHIHLNSFKDGQCVCGKEIQEQILVRNSLGNYMVVGNICFGRFQGENKDYQTLLIKDLFAYKRRKINNPTQLMVEEAVNRGYMTTTKGIYTKAGSKRVTIEHHPKFIQFLRDLNALPALGYVVVLKDRTLAELRIVEDIPVLFELQECSYGSKKPERFRLVDKGETFKVYDGTQQVDDESLYRYNAIMHPELADSCWDAR